MSQSASLCTSVISTVLTLRQVLPLNYPSFLYLQIEALQFLSVNTVWVLYNEKNYIIDEPDLPHLLPTEYDT